MGVLGLTMITSITTVYLPSTDIIVRVEEPRTRAETFDLGRFFAAVMPGTIVIAHAIWYAKGEQGPQDAPRHPR